MLHPVDSSGRAARGVGRRWLTAVAAGLSMTVSTTPMAMDTRPGWMMDAADFTGEVVRGRRDMYTPLEDFNGGPMAHIDGAFTDVADWPLGAIHAVLLSTGAVLTYGTTPDEDGVHENSTGFIYDVWNPALGLAPFSHSTLGIYTQTNIFCSGQMVLPGGKVLIAGGDQNELPGGRVNESIDHVNIFDPETNAMQLMDESMAYPRWYPTITTLPSGEQMVTGGRLAQDLPSEETGVIVPEIYNPDSGWRELSGASSQALWGYGWYYPRSFVVPSGKVLSFKDYRKEIFLIDPEGEGAIEQAARHHTILSAQDMPALMVRPGKIMTIYNQHAFLVDVDEDDQIQISETQPLLDQRHDPDATLLFDGSVLLSGGSRLDQELEESVYPVDIWSPETGTWHRGASAAAARLYHSTALLLKNGTVLTAGGGPPGPIANINAEIYYPPYLFKRDGSGELAERPVIARLAQPRYGASFDVELGDHGRIQSVAAIRTGSVTHSFDQSQRYIPLEFSQSGRKLSVAAPADNRTAPPGQYMLVVTDAEGVPSVGEIFELDNPPPVLLSHRAGEALDSDSALFRWAPNPAATRSRIWLGSAPGLRDIGGFGAAGASEFLGRRLPRDGRELHVRVGHLVDGVWQHRDTQVRAATLPEVQFSSHRQGERLSGDSAVFRWPAQTGAKRFFMAIGSAPGERDILRRRRAGSQTSVEVRGIPTDGRQLYATLWYRGEHDYWRRGESLALQAADWPSWGLIDPPAKARSTIRFTWPAMPGAVRYQLRVGTERNQRDLGYLASADATSATITDLPTDRELHVSVMYTDGRYWRSRKYVLPPAH